MSSIAVYAVVLAGWASGSKYPLLGGVRGNGSGHLLRGRDGACRWSPSCCIAGTLSSRRASSTPKQGPLTVLGRAHPAVSTWNVLLLSPSFVHVLHLCRRRNQQGALRPGRGRVRRSSAVIHTEYSAASASRLFFLAEYINMFNDLRDCHDAVPRRVEWADV